MRLDMGYLVAGPWLRSPASADLVGDQVFDLR